MGSERIYLTKKVRFKPKKEQSIILDCMCKSSTKLWNVANYEKRNYKELKMDNYPNWYEQKKRLKTNFWYKNLPSQTAQECLKVLEKSWKSFFKLKETKGIDNPQPPRFKKKNSKYNITYLNNGFQKNNDIFRFSIPKQQKEYLNKKYNIKSNYLYVKIKGCSQFNVKQVEFKPVKNNDYELFFTYEHGNIEYKQDNNKYLSIDLGITNLLTCYDSYNQNSFIISGRQLCSINQYFDKKISYYQSIYYAHQKKLNPELKHYKESKKIKRLYAKRQKQIYHLIHCATKQIVDYCIENDITKVVLGDIKGIRENINFGKQTNQKFHKLPFKQVVDKLKYKLQLQGIELVKQKENYSSQCSPLSEDVSKKYAKKSNRKYRGLYKDSNIIFNADSVGSYNIMRLYIKRNKKDIELIPKGLSNPLKYIFYQDKKYLCNLA